MLRHSATSFRPLSTSIVSLRPEQCRVLTVQEGAGDGIRVSCEVKKWER